MKNIVTLITLISLISFTACNNQELEQDFVPMDQETSALPTNDKTVSPQSDKINHGKANFDINNEGDFIFENDVLLLTNNSVNAVSYQWDFGNGDSSSLEQPTYKYEMHGNRTVKLTITDSYGNTHQMSKEILVLCVFGGGVHNQ